MERSGMGDSSLRSPDSAALHPGYALPPWERFATATSGPIVTPRIARRRSADNSRAARVGRNSEAYCAEC
jgi:hypothetical protein